LNAMKKTVGFLVFLGVVLLTFLDNTYRWRPVNGHDIKRKQQKQILFNKNVYDMPPLNSQRPTWPLSLHVLSYRSWRGALLHYVVWVWNLGMLTHRTSMKLFLLTVTKRSFTGRF
jgi:hypothetical protein